MTSKLLFTKLLLLISIVLWLSPTSVAQQFSYGNGSSGSMTVTGTQTVNQYYKVTAIHGNQISYVGSYAPVVGDVFLLMDMNDGVWQFDTVLVAGNPLTGSRLYRYFDTLARWPMQIITIPQFSFLTIDSGGILTCGAWNDTVGGVLCFMVHDSFIINSSGKCDVSAKGFIDHNSLGSLNPGGVGGIGGLAGVTGNVGGSSGIVLMSGSNGGGDGGLHGGSGGGSVYNFRRPSCDYCAHDNSNGYWGTSWNGSNLLGGLNSHLIMGGSGIPGNNGPSGTGAGGGGGGANGSGVAQDGSSGGSGGDGGSIGTAGIGGGILFFTANAIIVPSGPVLFANGGDGGNGGDGSNGGAGGNGGNGGDCLIGGGGGGGGGGNGGSGGGGGWGGASGIVFSISNHTSSSFNYSSTQTNGGHGGSGGHGGNGGVGGTNGMPGPSCGGGPTAGTLSSDSCSLVTLMNALNDLCDTIYHQYPSGGWWCTSTYPGANGYWVYGNQYQYHNNTFWQYTTAWARQVDSVTVDLWTIIGGRTYYTRITDQYRNHNPAPVLNNLMNGHNHIYYSSAGSGIVCDTSSFPLDTFLATCPVILSSPPRGANGSNGANGVSGAGGGGGGSGGGGGGLIMSCTSDPIVWPTAPTIECGCAFDIQAWESNIRGGGGIYNIHDTIIAPGVFQVHASSVYGCVDSYQLVIDTIDPFAYHVTLDRTIDVSCAGDSDGKAHFNTYWLFHGNTYCASQYWSISISGPNGYSYSINSLTYNYTDLWVPNLKQGTYYYTILKGACNPVTYNDSFVIATSVAQTNVINLQMCLGSNFQFGNHNVNQPGIYIDTFYYPSGCISSFTQYNITAYSYFNHVDIALCPYQTAYWQNHQFTQAGYYYDTSNCTITEIYVYNVSTPQSVLYDTICQGRSYNSAWHAYTQTGVYNVVISGASIYYCDSIVELHLFVKPAPIYDIFDTICHGDIFVFRNRSHTITGVYYDTTSASTMCDSILALHLFVSPPLVYDLFDTICHGGSLLFGSRMINAIGSYYDTLTATTGCDSILALHLFVLPLPQSVHYDTICQGRVYVFDTDTLIQSATITHGYTLPSGCDSSVTLHLWVNAPIALSTADTICLGQSYLFGNTRYDTSGVYTFTSASGNSCDTVHTLYLTVLTGDTPSAIITVSRGPAVGTMQTDTFTASYSSCSHPTFSWYHDTTALGIHTPVLVYSYPASQHDSILCRIDCDNRCTSVAYAFSNSLYTDIAELPSYIKGLKVYPNPSQASFSIELNAIADKAAQIVISDLIGQLVHTEPFAIHGGSNKKNIVLGDDIAAGVYVLRISTEDGSVYLKLELQK